MGKRKIYKGRQAGKVKRQERKLRHGQARKGKKAGKERFKGRQGKTEMQARKATKAGKKR